MPRKTSATSKQKASITDATAVTPVPAAASTIAPVSEVAVRATDTSRVEPIKLEVVKNEPRKNIVPISLDDEIRRRAYELAERRGFKSGHENEDWLAAEREVLQRYHQQSA